MPRSSLRESCLFRRSFLEPSLPSRFRCFIPPHLILALGDKTRNFYRPAVAIDCDESEIARVRVTPNTGLKILGFDSNSDFHRRATDKVHAALHDDQIADVDRFPEIDSIDRDRNTVHSGVTDRRYRGRRIHHRENDAAKYVVEIVGVLRHHQLRSFVLRLANCARWLTVAH